MQFYCNIKNAQSRGRGYKAGTQSVHRLITEIHAMTGRSRPVLGALLRRFEAELLD